MPSSPTARTLKELRRRGYPLADVTEKWIAQAMKRKDLFGFVDVLAVSRAGETVAIQTTSVSNMSARVHKITDSPALAILRLAKWRVWVWGWRKGKNGRYVLREIDLS